MAAPSDGTDSNRGDASNSEEENVMLEMRKLEQDILTSGKVDSHDLEVLRQRVYVGGKVGRTEADFLVELHKRLPHRTPSFDQFVYRAIKDHLVADGRIDASGAA